MRFEDRKIAHKEADYDGWVRARRHGVTATQVASASTPAGFERAVADYLTDWREPDNPYMSFGRAWEGHIAQYVEAEFSIEPNEWLLRGDFEHHLATPDGVRVVNNIVDVIGEYKTTGKDWDTVEKLPLRYRRQVQWQLHVSGAEACLVAWLLRKSVDTEDGPVFVPAWFDPKTGWIERDEKMIAQLVETAERLWELVGGS